MENTKEQTLINVINRLKKQNHEMVLNNIKLKKRIKELESKNELEKLIDKDKLKMDLLDALAEKPEFKKTMENLAKN